MGRDNPEFCTVRVKWKFTEDAPARDASLRSDTRYVGTIANASLRGQKKKMRLCTRLSLRKTEKAKRKAFLSKGRLKPERKTMLSGGNYARYFYQCCNL